VNYATPNPTPSPQPEPEIPNPVIGASESGADRKVAGALNQRLARLLKPTDNSDQLPPGTPPALQSQAAPTWVPTNALRVNPDSGRPLFSENLDDEVKRSVERRKSQKGMTFMSRLMLSKEAQEMLKGSEDEKPVQLLSLAGGVEINLQRLLGQELVRQPGSITEPVHVVDGPDGDLQIHVGRQVYSSVGEVPPGRILELLQQAVAEWMDSQGV
jgi:hypothetical protein